METNKAIDEVKNEVSERDRKIQELEKSITNLSEEFQNVIINKNENALELFKNSSKLISDATAAAISPFVARQDNFEIKMNEQFETIENNVKMIAEMLRPKPRISETRDAAYNCDICATKFSSEQELRKHRRNHHKT